MLTVEESVSLLSINQRLRMAATHLLLRYDESVT